MDFWFIEITSLRAEIEFVHLLTCNCETTYPLGHICSHHWVDPRGNLQETGKPVFFNHEICSLFSSFGACFVELDIM